MHSAPLYGPGRVEDGIERNETRLALSIYDITVPVMVHGLNVMDDYLEHAKALECAKELEPEHSGLSC